MNIEEIAQEGWKDTEEKFGDCHIYKNGEERLLYNPKIDEVIFHCNTNQICRDIIIKCFNINMLKVYKNW